MPRRKPVGPLSAAKQKEQATRAELGPRIGHPKSAHRPPTAPPSLGRERRHPVGPGHPTRDSPA